MRHNSIAIVLKLRMAKQHLKITDASVFDFSSCHRLANKENAGLIIRFKDLQQRNNWLQNAKFLRNHTGKINVAPDLPQVLRPLKKELLEKCKKSLPPKKKSNYQKSAAMALC